MPSVNHLKNKDAQYKTLTVAYGLQAVAGHLTRSYHNGTQIVAFNALGEGPWDACIGAYYDGNEILPADYNFHTGDLATGMTTGPQVVDSFFTGDVPHSRTAAIGYKCPVGLGDPDTRANPPLEFEGLFRTRKCLDFDDSGEYTGISYSASPARVLVDLLMNFGRIPNLPAIYDSHRDYWHSRIDWESWTDWLNYCADTETVDYRTWPDFDGFGLTVNYYNGTNFDTQVVKFVQPVIDLELGALAPASGVTANNCSGRFEGYIKTKEAGNYTFSLTHSEGAKLWIDGVLVIDQWAASGTHTSSAIALSSDTFYDIKIEWKNTGTAAELSLEWSSATVPNEVIPSKNLYPKAESRPRYEAHVFFDSPVNFAEAIREVLRVSNSVMQDVNGKLHFFCLEQLISTFTFDDTNIDKIKFRRRDILRADPITALESKFKDLDSQFLEEPETPVRYEPSYLGRKNAENVRTVPLYNTTRWQAMKVLMMRAKLEVEYDLITELESKTAKSYTVIPGDVVTVSHRKLGEDPVTFIVRETTDEGVPEATEDKGDKPENRTFVMQEWN